MNATDDDRTAATLKLVPRVIANAVVVARVAPMAMAKGIFMMADRLATIQ